FIFEILSLKEQQLFKRFAFFGTLGESNFLAYQLQKILIHKKIFFSSLTLDHIGYWTDLFYAIIRKRTQLKINHSRLSQFKVLLQPLKDDDALVQDKET
ncbi:hypothetical protein BpHYR1_000480, partial [Brachionus plicatilis]